MVNIFALNAIPELGNNKINIIFAAMRIFGYDIRFGRRQEKVSRRHHEVVDFFAPQKCIFNFAESEILDCEKMITSRLANAEYHAKIGYFATTDIFKFIQENRLQMVRRLFYDGYVIINTECFEFVDVAGRRVASSFNGKYCFELYEHEIIQTSETFEATGFSDYHFLKDKIKFLNIVNSSDMNLIDNYGAMGIVSPESDNSVAGAEFAEKDIEELQRRYSKSYGLTFGKWSLMFVPRPTKYSPISLPIAQLKLEDKRLYLLKAIYAAFGIPKELSVYFENSKYSNLREAELAFYSSTITAWADMFLIITKKMYNEIGKHKKLDYNEFWYDFVGVFALQEAMYEERERAKAELEFWRNISATSPEYAETARLRINNLLESI